MRKVVGRPYGFIGAGSTLLAVQSVTIYLKSYEPADILWPRFSNREIAQIFSFLQYRTGFHR